MIGESGATRWLEPLLPALPEVTSRDTAALCRFERALRALLHAHPVWGLADARERSRNLREIRHRLAAAGHLALAVPARDGGYGRPPAMQVLLQFICGYHDVDLRDSTGLGHGLLIAAHATSRVRDRWLPRLLAGAVPGIAITEPHGGSQVHATATYAVPAGDGTWRVSGNKTWISRLTEAAVFCVFFTAPDGRLTVAAIDARAGGLSRRLITPSGLSGWTWGELRLDAVAVRSGEILGQPGDGMRLLHEHFARYRPLVAATALGAAAAVHDRTATLLIDRRQSGAIARVRDNALIALGRTGAQLNAALLAAITAHRLAEAGHPTAQAWGCGVKAHSADVAYQAASELALLAGAAGFTSDSRTAKTRADLNALLYADGIHDSLYRAVGRTFTRGSDRQVTGLPFSSVATLPVATASRHDATRRASSGVTRSPTSSLLTNAKPESSPSASTISLVSASDSTPPSYTTITPSGRSGRDGTQSTASIRPGGRSSPSSSATSRRQAACGDSSASTAPPGRSHASL
jgi:alkylation response protein AidB-like acyl-CoA dehydrogenase